MGQKVKFMRLEKCPIGICFTYDYDPQKLVCNRKISYSRNKSLVKIHPSSNRNCTGMEVKREKKNS